MADLETNRPAAPTVRHLEQLMEGMTAGVILVDPSGALIGANPAALRMHGVAKVQDLGTTADDYCRLFCLRYRNHHRLAKREYPIMRMLAGESFPDLVVEVSPIGINEPRWTHLVHDVVMDEDGGDPVYVTVFADRHGKRRWRFRRKGYKTHYFKSPHGTKAFEREYAACLDADQTPIALHAVILGSINDIIGRYYSDNAFRDLAKATQGVYRGVLERFREDFGDVSIKAFDAKRIAHLMNHMHHIPHAAARLRKLLAQLLQIARRDKLVPSGFDPIKDTKPPKTTSKGYHRWTEEELTRFEDAHGLGTKPRLAFDLLLYGAQRSGDVRFMDPAIIAGGRIRLDQNKTTNAVDIPVVAPLQASLDAGPLGFITLLETKDGKPFTEKGFYGMMKKACRKAGLDHCSPHGLRKAAARRCKEAGCSNEEGMAITGHKSVKEYLRYAGSDARPEVADAAMKKVMANRSARLAIEPPQTIEKRPK